MSAKHEAPRIRWLVEPCFDDDGVQRTAGIDHRGREHGDPIPVSPPVGLDGVPARDELHDALRRMFNEEKQRWMAAVQAEEFETEDDANDFDVPEDMFPPGNEPWEDIFELPDVPEGSKSEASQRPSNGEGEAVKEPPQPASILDRTSFSDLSVDDLERMLEQKRSASGMQRGALEPVAGTGNQGSLASMRSNAPLSETPRGRIESKRT